MQKNWYKHRYKGISNTEAVELYLNNINKTTFKQKCLDNGLDYGKAHSYKQRHRELSDDEVINILTSPKKETFTDKCRQQGIIDKKQLKNLCTFRSENKHLGYTDEQIIDKYKTEVLNNITFKHKCDKAGVNHLTALKYKSIHHELTEEQVIIHYRPDCYINIFGELVIPN